MAQGSNKKKAWNKGIHMATNDNFKRMNTGPKENHPRWKGGLPKCIDCGKGLKAYQSKRCYECRGFSQRLLVTRKDERHTAMRRKEYILWRIAVFMRDDYACIQCNQKGYLEADHIKPWALYPELRYAIDNGRTLCKSCHQQTDTYPVNLRGGYQN